MTEEEKEKPFVLHKYLYIQSNFPTRANSHLKVIADSINPEGNIFLLLSLNLHYEILKYAAPKDIQSIRAINYYAYVLCTNDHHRHCIAIKYESPSKLFMETLINGYSGTYDLDIVKHTRMVQLTKLFANIIELDLSSVQFTIGSEKMNLLGNIMKSFPEIRSINLRGNWIEDQGARKLATYLFNLPNLWGNGIRKAGAIAIAENFKYIPKLKELIFTQNGIAAAGAIQISENLQYLPNLTSINLNGNGIRKEGGIAIANSLKNIPNLEELKIVSGLLENEGAKEIYENLKYLPLLKVLDLRANNISEELKHSFKEKSSNVLEIFC